jgi:lipid-A-disaccharide synthase
MAVRIFVSAGETSGDRHAAALIRALRTRVGAVEVRGLGGPSLAAEGADLIAHTADLSVIGFSEIVPRLPFFLRTFQKAIREIETWKPDLVLPVDYPGFNLRLGRKARVRGVPVVYYIAPQVWAWRRERRPGIARAVDRLLVVFPFEVDLFREAGIDTTFVGHPLLDLEPGSTPEETRQSLGFSTGDTVLALLPGSRPQEVAQILPGLLPGTLPLVGEGVRIVVSRAPGLPDHLFRMAEHFGCGVWTGPARDLAAAADAALVASGTATLETGLRGTPMAVVYRTGGMNWTLARALVRIRTVGLVNIAAGGDRVPELLQDALVPKRVEHLARRILFDPEERREQKTYLAGLRDRLGGTGAADRAAEAVARTLEGGTR